MHQSRLPLVVSFAIASCLFAVTARAEESEAAAEAEHEHHTHHVAVFGGATTTSADTAFTLGVDYEYRLPFLGHVLGIGPILDFAFAHEVVQLYMAGVFVHPFMGFKLIAAPGLEREAGHGVFVIRGGLAYDIHIDHFSVSPTFSVDLADGHAAYVYGVGLGMGF